MLGPRKKGKGNAQTRASRLPASGGPLSLASPSFLACLPPNVSLLLSPRSKSPQSYIMCKGEAGPGEGGAEDRTQFSNGRDGLGGWGGGQADLGPGAPWRRELAGWRGGERVPVRFRPCACPTASFLSASRRAFCSRSLRRSPSFPAFHIYPAPHGSCSLPSAPGAMAAVYRPGLR